MNNQTNDTNNYNTHLSGAGSQVGPDENELKLLKEVMKMSELDYLKDAGAININAIKRKNNKEQEDDIDNLFGAEKPLNAKPLNRGASDF
jgi:hypothetical protein